MRILDWLASLLRGSDKETQSSSLFTPASAPPSAVAPDERVFCFARGRQTICLEPGQMPRTAGRDEKYAIIPAKPVRLSLEHGGLVYDLDIETDPGDALAATLEHDPGFTAESLSVLCANALASMPAAAAALPPERLRALVSLELLLSGFRCAGLAASPAPPAPPAPQAGEEASADDPPEPEGTAAELADEWRAVASLAARHGLPVPAPESAPEALAAAAAAAAAPNRDALAAGLRAATAQLASRLLEYREDLADSRSLEARMNLSHGGPIDTESPIEADGASGLDVPDPKRPFTLLVWRRTDIDDKLRRYADETLAGAAQAARQFRREALGRHFKLGARADALAGSIENLRLELASWPVLRHKFSYTRPGPDLIRRRVKTIRKVADAAAGTRNAVAWLCQQPLREADIAEALDLAEASRKTLSEVMRDPAL